MMQWANLWGMQMKEFEIGDIVWDLKYGWGEVLDDESEFGGPVYPVKVVHVYIGPQYYSKDGKWGMEFRAPTLFHADEIPDFYKPYTGDKPGKYKPKMVKRYLYALRSNIPARSRWWVPGAYLLTQEEFDGAIREGGALWSLVDDYEIVFPFIPDETELPE